MSHEAEISIAPPELIPLSAAAKRMRNHRERRGADAAPMARFRREDPRYRPRLGA